MNKTEIVTGQLKMKQQHFKFDVDALTTAINSFGKGFNLGGNYVIFGCGLTQVNNDVVLEAGAVFINGESYIVDSSTYGSTTVEAVRQFYFDLNEYWDISGNLTVLVNGQTTTKNTRKVRKAVLSPSASVFTNSQYSTIQYITQNLVDAIQLNATNLSTHIANYNGHNFLPNTGNNGGTYAATPTVLTAGVILDTNVTNYKSYSYLVGNLVYWNFTLTFDVVGPVNNISLEMPEWFAVGNGYTTAVIASPTEFNSLGGLLGGSSIGLVVVTTNSTEGRKMWLNNIANSQFLTGSYTIAGTMIFKKLETSTGVPA